MKRIRGSKAGGIGGAGVTDLYLPDACFHIGMRITTFIKALCDINSDMAASRAAHERQQRITAEVTA